MEYAILAAIAAVVIYLYFALPYRAAYRASKREALVARENADEALRQLRAHEREHP